MGSKKDITMVMITRDDCPLCDEMKEVIQKTQTAHPFVLIQLPVTTTPELMSAYETRFPYLFVSGHSFAKGQVDPQKLSLRLAAQDRIFKDKALPEVVTAALKQVEST